MTRYMIAAVAAALLASQAEAQIIVNTGGFGTPAGVYSPFGSMLNTSGYYTSGYTPYYNSGYTPYYSSSYYSGYSPSYSGYNYGTRYYNSGSYANYGNYGNYGRSMYRGRGWRW